MVKAISVKKTKAIQFSALTQSISKRKAPRSNIRVMVIHATSIRHNEHKHCPSYHTKLHFVFNCGRLQTHFSSFRSIKDYIISNLSVLANN